MNLKQKKQLIKIVVLAVCASFLLTHAGFAACCDGLRPQKEKLTIKQRHSEIKRLVSFTEHELANFIQTISMNANFFYYVTKDKEIGKLKEDIEEITYISNNLWLSVINAEDVRNILSIAEYNRKWLKMLNYLREKLRFAHERIEELHPKIDPTTYRCIFLNSLAAYQLVEDVVCLLSNESVENTRNVNLKEVFKHSRLDKFGKLEIDPGICVFVKRGTLLSVFSDIRKKAAEAASITDEQYYLNIKGYADGNDAVLEFVNPGQIGGCEDETSTMKTFIEAYGGTIKAENLSTEEIKVTVRLPLAQDKLAEMSESKQASEGSGNRYKESIYLKFRM